MFARLFHRLPALIPSTKTQETSVAGMRLTVHPTVFHPKNYLSSKVLAQHILGMNLEGKRVLDCGTGTGVLAIAAAKRGAIVTAVDINDLALEATKENAERNDVTLRILHSDWFSALGEEKFDLIVANPPFIRGTGMHPYNSAWHAGENHEHVLGLIEGCDDHLAPNGEALVVLSHHSDIEFWINEFSTEGLHGECIYRSLFSRFMIFRFSD